MSDVFSKEKRSDVMSRIRGKGNRDTELALIRIMRRHHISGWRRNQPFFGKPDFVFPKQKIAIFVDGCFWHGCPSHSNLPKNNREFWEKKLGSNKARDALVTRHLRRDGWTVLRFWEHEMKEHEKVANRILKALAAATIKTQTPNKDQLPK